MNNKVFNLASITPDKIRAGDSDEFSIKLEIGPAYTASASRIVFDFSCTLGTSCPTRQLNECSGYVETYVTNAEVKHLVRCWDLDHKYFADQDHPPSREAMRMVVLDLSPGLRKGDTVELKWGETLGGFGPGAKVSSVVPRPDYKARIDIRYFKSQSKGMPDYGRDYGGYKRPQPDALLRLEYRILPREPRRLRLLRKSAGAILIPYDVFWNVARVKKITEIVTAPAKPRRNRYGAFEYADKNITVRPKNLTMTVSPAMDHVHEGMNIYWGDLHTHSMYSIDCAQRSGMDMTPGNLMEFARYRAGLDFFAVTDHHNPHMKPTHHIGRKNWESTLEDIKRHHADGKFVVFPGIEFSDRFGDICLVFNYLPKYGEITKTSYKKVLDFYRAIGKKFMAIPHFHAPGRAPAGTWRRGIAEVSPALEIYSDHGSYEREEVFENGRAWCKAFRKDRCAEYFIKNSWRYGFAANSDDHKGHAGVNGLTAVFAKQLSRDAIFQAYRDRHVYGTTNARIRLIFTANGRLMGSEIPLSGRKEFRIDIAGENKLKKVDVFRNGELFRRFAPANRNFTKEFSIDDDNADNWYIRATQTDNHAAYSSPVWFVTKASGPAASPA